VGSAHGLFLKSEGRLKACVQVSDDLSYFRGYSPRYKLKIAGNIVLFDCVSIDVAQQAIACISKIVYVAEPQATCGRRKL
jgi:hypothetical protein